MAGIKNKRCQPLTWGEFEPTAAFRKLYRPLGALAYTFADLEEEVTGGVQALLGTSWKERTAIEWLMQNFSMRIELFYFLARTAVAGPQGALTAASKRGEERTVARENLATRADGIYTDLQQANSDRNNLLHGAWVGLSTVTPMTYAKSRMMVSEGQLKEIPIKGISIELLRKEADFFIALRMRVAHWTACYRRLHMPHTWPPTLPEKCLRRSPLGPLVRQHKSEAKKRQRAASRA
jgi:hypothetical protein